MVNFKEWKEILSLHFRALRDTEKYPAREGETITEDAKKKDMKVMLVYSGVMTVLTAAISVWFGSRYADHHVFNNIKCMMLLAML